MREAVVYISINIKDKNQTNLDNELYKIMWVLKEEIQL